MIIKTITGRGFIKDSAGNIIDKTAFPPKQEILLTEGYYYIEAAETELNAWTPPERVLNREEVIERLISQKIRKIAAQQLVVEGLITLAEQNKI